VFARFWSFFYLRLRLTLAALYDCVKFESRDANSTNTGCRGHLSKNGLVRPTPFTCSLTCLWSLPPRQSHSLHLVLMPVSPVAQSLVSTCLLRAPHLRLFSARFCVCFPALVHSKKPNVKFVVLTHFLKLSQQMSLKKVERTQNVNFINKEWNPLQMLS